MFGVGLQERIPWPTVVIVGFGLVGVQVVAIPTIAIAYAIDCYRPLAGEIMAIATVCKNTFGVRHHLLFWTLDALPSVIFIVSFLLLSGTDYYCHHSSA